MRILIISDTHGNRRAIDRVLKEVGPIDGFIHLGDVERDEEYIETVLDCPSYIVAGNNDFFSNLPDTLLIQLGKYKVFLTHGHGYYVSCHTRRIKEIAKEKEVDIVMYGHTHRPNVEYDDELILVNPGSLAYPRQEGRRSTYIIMNLDENGEVKFEIQYM